MDWNEFNIRLWTYAYIVQDPKVTSEGEGEGGGRGEEEIKT